MTNKISNKSKDYIEMVAEDIVLQMWLNINKLSIEHFDRSKCRKRSGKLLDGGIPISKRNHSVYEKTEYKTHIHRKSNGLNLFEIPLLAKKKDYPSINETNIYEIPLAQRTKNTKDTIDYVIDYTKLDRNHIQDYYYSSENKIAMCIVAFWLQSDISDEELTKIIRLFNNAGYYLADDEIVTTSEEDDYISGDYIKLYFEPYWPEENLIRHNEFIYHITPAYNDYEITTYGLNPKSELHKNNISTDKKNSTDNYPDRIYFFLDYDFNAMLHHIRSSRKLKRSENGELLAVIYKIKKPDNVKLYIDTREIDNDGNLIESCAYTYDKVPPEYIIEKKIFDVQHQSFFI